MGFDMYLTGEEYFFTGAARELGDKKAELFDLGYWRKHPNLHGYIVETFCDGMDDCRQISLDISDLEKNHYGGSEQRIAAY